MKEYKKYILYPICGIKLYEGGGVISYPGMDDVWVGYDFFGQNYRHKNT